MVQLDKVKIKIQEYILSQIDSLGATNPAIKLVKPLAKRAIVNNMDGIDKWLRKRLKLLILLITTISLFLLLVTVIYLVVM